MARNQKNDDRFFKNYPIRTYASTSSEEFTGIVATGPSNIVDVSDSPMVTWTLQVSGDPVAATSWSVVLEGSSDGINFSEILNHTSLVGDGINLYSGTTLFLTNYYRVNVVSLTLGAASSISVAVIGRQ